MGSNNNYIRLTVWKHLDIIKCLAKILWIDVIYEKNWYFFTVKQQTQQTFGIFSGEVLNNLTILTAYYVHAA